MLAQLAFSHGLVVRLQQHSAGQSITAGPGPLSSEWMVMARTATDLGSLATDARWITPAIPPSTPLLTDDCSNILSVLSLNRR